MKLEEAKQKALKGLVFRKRPPRRWHRDLNSMGWFSQKGRICVTDKELYERILYYTCAICGEGPDADIRHLNIGCLYAVDEVSTKFKRGEGNYYSIQICKGCRSFFLFECLAPFIKNRGRLAHPGLDEDGIIAFNTSFAPSLSSKPVGDKFSEGG